MKNITVLNIAYHRNGVSGAPFHLVHFKESGFNMLATVFDEPGVIAVVCLDYLPNIAFGENSWRGDQYEQTIREAIKENE